MLIHDLSLENFHGFEKRHITFSEQFTVLIGDNGTGKTAILDGLAVALKWAGWSTFKAYKKR